MNRIIITGIYFRAAIFSIFLLLTACVNVSAEEGVWIDVRTVAEYDDDHINGDLNIPLAEIDVAEFSSMFAKDDEINLYCRSGNRAGQAKQILEAACFTNVNNRGGISDAREIRNIAVQSESQ